jgi:hypothetical protein
MNKKGMTLVELAVYMVLAALVLAPVIMLVNNTSISMARDAGRTNLQMSGREIMQIIYDDLKNTGFKIWPNGNDFLPEPSATIFVSGTNYFYRTGSDVGKCCRPGCIDSAAVPDGCKTKCNVSNDGCKNITFIEDGTTKTKKEVDPDNIYIVKDSSSFVNGNSYILPQRWSATSNAWVFDQNNQYLYPNATNCGTSCKSLVSRYDTLEARMGKLNKAGEWEGEGAYMIRYYVKDTTNFMLARKVIPPGTLPSQGRETVLARNVAAFKIRFSDNLKDWYDYFDKTKRDHILKKIDMQYIKVILVLRDPKKLAATKSQSIMLIPAVPAGDVTNGYHRSNDAIVLTPTDQALYEKYEMVIPIPNNGLYP